MSVWQALKARRAPISHTQGLAAQGLDDQLRLALQTALIGQITSTMRLISAERDDAGVRVIVFFERTLEGDDQLEFEAEVASCVGLRLGDPPAGPPVRCFFIRCDEPQRIPVRGEIIFSRKGVSAF